MVVCSQLAFFLFLFSSFSFLPRYYFAIVQFDSVEAADKVYEECNGLELENTSNVLDLRFIPDDMTFDDPPR